MNVDKCPVTEYRYASFLGLFTKRAQVSVWAMDSRINVNKNRADNQVDSDAKTQVELPILHTKLDRAFAPGDRKGIFTQ